MATTGLRAWTLALTCALCTTGPAHVVRAEEPESAGKPHHHHHSHGHKSSAPAPRPLAIPPPAVEAEPAPAEVAPPPLMAKRGAWYGPAYVTVSSPRVMVDPQQAPPAEPPAGPTTEPPASAPEPPRLPEPPVVGAAGTVQQRVDLSLLPEVEDRSLEASGEAPAPGDARVPRGYRPPRRTELPYLGEMSSEPDLHFVPESPSLLNARLAWEDMMAPTPLTQAEIEARRLRNTGIALLASGAVAFLVSVPMMVQGVELTATREAGYGLCGVSLGALAAGGVVLGVGEHRLRLAREAALGVAMAPAPRLLVGPGLGLEF